MKNKRIKRTCVLCAIILVVGYFCHYSGKSNADKYDSIIYNVAEQYKYNYKKNKIVSNMEVFSYTLTKEPSDVEIRIDIYISSVGDDEIAITANHEIKTLEERISSLLPHMKVIEVLIEELSAKCFPESTLVAFLKSGEESGIEDPNSNVIMQKIIEGNGYLIDYFIAEEEELFRSKLFEYFSVCI